LYKNPIRCSNEKAATGVTAWFCAFGAPAVSTGISAAMRLSSGREDPQNSRTETICMFSAKPKTPTCSFCHKPESDNRRLIETPDDNQKIFICEECVRTCYELLNYEADKKD
jgi:hypothetical protein